MTQPLGPNQERWLRELETTDKKQGKKVLRSKDDEYCCLGIGCELIGLEPQTTNALCCYSYGANWYDELAPTELIEYLGLYTYWGSPRRDDKGAEDIASMNDHGKTFKEIAAIIRADPSMYFSEPR
ncbi:MAG: hypothetical protein JJ939_11500 [Alphaproteobacteria bacterium]|nr:hypothetical protein [Alphaproteobacteria bacterium]MBO6629040.1 hypothetical protein [Alphaproteobacteria bacterium]